MVGFRTTARTSSRTKTPRKLVEYAQTPAASIRTITPNAGTCGERRFGSTGFVRVLAARRRVATGAILRDLSTGSEAHWSGRSLPVRRGAKPSLQPAGFSPLEPECRV
jgi:hypothetical protein